MTSHSEKPGKIEKKLFLHSLFLPGILILVLWLLQLIEMGSDFSFANWGIFPRKINTLTGIITYPLIHGDYIHLINNSLPLLALSVALLYFYRGLGYRVFIALWLISGFLLWLSGRPAYHIGASGLVYGLAAFLFFSGIIRRHPRLIAISLIVVFLYGYMVWGVFPMKINVSWEGHLWGAITGLVLSIVFRKQGPQKPRIEWEDDDDDDPEESKEHLSEASPYQTRTDNPFTTTNTSL